MEDEALSALIRQRLEHGQLPNGAPDRVLAGYGGDAACACCCLRIEAHEVEYEILFGAQSVLTHVNCYRIWCEISTREAIQKEYGSGRVSRVGY